MKYVSSDATPAKFHLPILALADNGIGALKGNPGFELGLNVHGGKIVNAAVAQSLGFD